MKQESVLFNHFFILYLSVFLYFCLSVCLLSVCLFLISYLPLYISGYLLSLCGVFNESQQILIFLLEVVL